MPKRFQIEMPFAPPPYDKAMLDAHSLSVVADQLVFCLTSTETSDAQVVVDDNDDANLMWSKLCKVCPDKKSDHLMLKAEA